MTNLRLLPPPPAPAVVAPLEQVQGFTALWLSQVAPTSARAYGSSLSDFAAHLGLELELAVLALLRDRAGVHAMTMAYRAKLLEARKAPATINLRLAALRSLVSHARALGLIDWSLEVAGVKATPYRDTRGPGRAGFRALVQVASNPRDRAILWLLYGLALRRAEVCRLDADDVQGDVVLVQGKGSREKTPLTLPPACKGAIEAWLQVRGSEAGPLFRNQHRSTRVHTRISDRSIARILCRLAKRANLNHVRPHGLRHAAITDALELTRGDLRQVQRFSRHADVRTLLRYDDARTDMAGAVAALVAGAADL